MLLCSVKTSIFKSSSCFQTVGLRNNYFKKIVIFPQLTITREHVNQTDKTKDQTNRDYLIDTTKPSAYLKDSC